MLLFWKAMVTFQIVMGKGVCYIHKIISTLHQGARIARRTAHRPCPPDFSAPASRPVHLRPAPGREVAVWLGLTTSLQFLSTSFGPPA